MGKVQDRATQQLLRIRRPEQFHCGEIDIDVLHVLVHENRLGRQLHQAPVPVLRFAQRVLGLPALGDVLHRTDHADGLAGGIPDHKPAVQNESIGPVATAEAVFAGPGLPSGIDQRVNPADDPLPVLRMNGLVPGFDSGFGLVRQVAEQGPESLVPPDLVVEQIPVPDDIVGCPGDDLEPFDCTQQHFPGLPALDGDASERGGGLNQLQFAGIRLPWLAVVHRQCPQQPSVMGDDRVRPAGAQAMAQGQLPIVLPQWIGGDLLHHDHFLAPGRCAARARARPDGHAIDRCAVFRGEAGCRRIQQAGAGIVDKLDRAQQLRRLPLHQPGDGLQRFGKGSVRCDQLQQLPLADQHARRAPSAREPMRAKEDAKAEWPISRRRCHTETMECRLLACRTSPC